MQQRTDARRSLKTEHYAVLRNIFPPAQRDMLRQYVRGLVARGCTLDGQPHGLWELRYPSGRLARWAWPIWMYVSVTGVVIYFMLRP